MRMSDYDHNRYNSWSNLYDKLMLAGYYDYDSFVESLSSAISEYSLYSCLEIGIGTGLVASQLVARNNIDLLGIDFSEGMIEVCRKNFPNLRTIVGDVAEYDFGMNYDLVFSVGGPWYFMQRGSDLIFCSHLPELTLQNQSIDNVCRSMRPGAVLALAIQGPHVDLSRTIDDSLTYSQKIRIKDDVGDIFEKDYIFFSNGKKINEQTCLFRLSAKYEIEKKFALEGVFPLQFGTGDKFVFYRKH